MTKKQQTVGELGPNEVVRKCDGFRYFGLKATALDAAIKAGLIPKPIRLTSGGRAVGWLGWQILEYQHRLVEAARSE